MSNEPHDSTPSEGWAGEARDHWKTERTTFQRVYDVVTGTSDYISASVIATHAECSDDGARDALSQLVEMGIAEKREGRPAEYRRNDSYFRWKRIEELAESHTVGELRSRIDELMGEDEAFQTQFDVPSPDAISPTMFEVTDHDEMHERWEAVSRWRSVRHDIEVLQQAAHRAEREGHDTGDTVSA